MVYPNVGPIGPRRSRSEVLIVEVRLVRHVRQRIVVQQRLRRRADLRLRNDDRRLALRSQIRQITVAVRQRRDEKLLRHRRRAPVPFIVHKEEGLVRSVVQVRNPHRTAQRPAKRIEPLRSLPAEPVRVRIQRIVLQILKQAAMKRVRATLRCERHVAHLRELRAVVERRHLHRRNSLLRRICVLQSSVLTDIRRRNTIH